MNTITEQEIRRLRVELEQKEAQMKIDRLIQMGFKGSSEDVSLVKDGDFIITANKDYKLDVIPSVRVKDWTWYNMTLWAFPKDLKPSVLEEVKRKLHYQDRIELLKFLGEIIDED